MHNIKTVIYFMCTLTFLAVHCNALIGKKSGQPVNKGGCIRLGEVCTTGYDCCGHDDPDTHRVNSNVCNGPDRSGNIVCCTRVLLVVIGIIVATSSLRAMGKAK
ncbi:unnamed protein product [Rotaria magnacalcarata]|uniref:Uncharacterized protein n=1 Tax=Rotaria magnacalcarata TaxID=392030 RepID=A0A820QZ62_9BILA|nr:unnamed protein product [Rotaria magnacalcarata]